MIPKTVAVETSVDLLLMKRTKVKNDLFVLLWSFLSSIFKKSEDEARWPKVNDITRIKYSCHVIGPFFLCFHFHHY